MLRDPRNDPERHRELHQLLADFTTKISQEWAQTFDTTQHGDSYRGIGYLPSKNAFYHDLADVLNARYKAQYGLDAASAKEIKAHTVRRVLEEGTARSFDDKTCDVLAVYLGYASWAAYRMRMELTIPEVRATAYSRRNRNRIPALMLVLVLLAGGGYYAYRRIQTSPPGERLTIVNVSSPHAPTKVTVQYDLRGLDFDQVYVAYGKERVIPQREQGILTFDAFLPLCISVQLYIDNKLLAEAPLVVGSEGWEGYINLLVPLEKESFYQKGVLRLAYQQNPTTADKEEFYPTFLNFHDYGVSADRMLFEARVLNNASMGGTWAYDISVDLVGSRDRAYFNVLSPDAVLYARAGVAEIELNGGKNHELKALGYAMDDWCVLAMRIENHTAVIMINGKEVLSIPYREELGNLHGVQFYIKGSGAVDWVRVTDLEDDEVKYFDDFLGESAVAKK